MTDIYRELLLRTVVEVKLAQDSGVKILLHLTIPADSLLAVQDYGDEGYYIYNSFGLRYRVPLPLDPTQFEVIDEL